MLILGWNYIFNENAHQAIKNAIHVLKIQNMPYLNGSYNLVLPHASIINRYQNHQCVTNHKLK